jgi:uncharacterized protein involved in exopolysaccharide biosynthesis
MNSDSATPASAGTQPKSPSVAPPSLPFGIVFAVWLLVVLSTALVTFILPESFASTARIKIEQDTSEIRGATERGGASPDDPHFIQTEFEVIQSELVLSKVIKDLDLNAEWGKRYNAGNGPLKTTESLGLLKARLDLRLVSNTSLIDIRVFSERPDEAARLANAIATAYRDYRLKKRAEMVAAGQTDRSLAATGSVEIVDHAVPSSKPIRPNKPLNLLLGNVAGVCAGLLLASIVHATRLRAFRLS